MQSNSCYLLFGVQGAFTNEQVTLSGRRAVRPNGESGFSDGRTKSGAGPYLADTYYQNHSPGRQVSNDWNSLLNNAKTGDEPARNRLFELLRTRLLTIAQFRLRGWPVEEIEDIVQDSLAVVFTKLGAVSDNPQYFALAVLENKVGGLLRLKRRRTMISLNPTGSLNENDEGNSDIQLPSESHDEMLEHLHGSEISDKLNQALRKLSPICQAVFLALLKLQSVADVWSAFQEKEPKLSRNAFDKRLFDCRRKLRDITAGQLA